MTMSKWKAKKREPETFDLTSVDYSCTLVTPDGMKVSLACWTGPKPQPDDYVLLRNGEHSTRYRVTEMDYCMNVDPPTMWMARAEFDPRPANG